VKMFYSLLLLALAGAGLPIIAQGACPGASHGRGKRVFCYYEGKRSPSEVDPCPCSHILYKNVATDHHSRIIFTDRQKSDVQALKEVNPRLSILVSLGGDIISGDTFRSIVARKDQLSNFTESLNSLYQEQVIQGIEMDWEWPMDTMDKKDKIKLIRYMRQLKIATGDKNIRRRIVRSPESTTMLMETTTTTTRDETTINLDDSPVNDSETTTEWSPQR